MTICFGSEAGLRPSRSGDAGDDGAAVDAAGGIADRGVHAAVDHRLDGLRHRVHAANQDLGTPVRLHTLAAASAMSSLWKNAASIFGNVLRYAPRVAPLRDVPIRRIGRQDRDTREPVDDRLESARTPLRTGVSERALRHDNRALAADRVHERLGDRGAHEVVVGRKKCKTSI